MSKAPKSLGTVTHKNSQGEVLGQYSIGAPMPQPCKDCPFTSKAMQASLARGRLDGIKNHVAKGGFFPATRQSTTTEPRT